ncbi:MAG: YgfZ/GcvT domain-containing protein [Ignavibacteriales bacterium]
MPETANRISPYFNFFSSVYENIVLNENGSVVKVFTDSTDEYNALFNGVAFRDISNCGITELQGKDGLDFLHRISTNALKDLKPGTAASTIFTNEKGRILDRALVVNWGDSLLLFNSMVYANKLAAWLNRYIIMEDLKVTGTYGKYAAFEFIGPQAESFLTMIFGKVIDTLGLNEVKKAEAEDSDVFVMKLREFNLTKYLVFGNVEQGSTLLKNIHQQNNVFDFRVIGEDAYEVYRIVKGIPAAPNELNDSYNPHEINLLDEVSFTKGCYIGQEVIARLDTYDKVQKKLTGLIFDTEEGVTDSNLILIKDEDEVGKITTLGRSFYQKKAIALAILRKEYNAAGTQMIAKNGSGKEYKVTICNLPLKK